MLLALPVHILQHSPIQSFFSFSCAEDFSWSYNGYAFRVLLHPHQTLSYFVFLYVCLLIWIPRIHCLFYVSKFFLLYIYIYDARVSPYFLCDSLFIFQLLWHFCDKKGKNIKYLTHLKKREGRSLKMGDHWILNSF